MAGGGNYPVMMDCEWRDAPWNEPDIRYDICPCCDGEGCDYCDYEGEIEY